MIDQTAAQRLGLGEKLDAFTAVLLGEDTLGVVIRAHIYIEHQLIEFIEARMSSPEVIDALDLTYTRRVKLALALGLPSEFKAQLHFIGTLRNQFAHRLDAEIGQQEADAFEKTLGDSKEIALSSYIATKKKLRQDPPAIHSAEPKDRVILYLVTLWAGIAVAAVRARAN